MRIPALVMIGALAACTSSVTVPQDSVLYEVPAAGTASTAGGADNFTSTIESSLAEGGVRRPRRCRSLAPRSTMTG